MKAEVNKKENRKAFLRILKETGLYPEWAKCRKRRIDHLKQLDTHESYDLFSMEIFGDILVYSFGWDSSKISNLWCALSSIKERPKDIVKSDALMDRIKSTIKLHTSKNK
jgi:hypothetical protein